MKKPRFLTYRRILQIHDTSLAQHGGSAGIRDEGMIHSALASARNIFYYANGDLFDVAAGYTFHIVSALTFLELNGVRLVPDQNLVYDTMIAIAEKRLNKKGLAEVFRKLGEKVCNDND